MTNLLIAGNSKAQRAILEMKNIYISHGPILSRIDDGVDEATLYFRRSIWSKQLDLTLRSLADLLECSVTEYLYDKDSGQIIVCFKR
ncbi:MAG: hypothetical protein EB127_02760 [Alphaproteobacteria bacterium]|nr:hypothetical protein [Alphaproteobacteria bacterium]